VWLQRYAASAVAKLIDTLVSPTQNTHASGLAGCPSQQKPGTLQQLPSTLPRTHHQSTTTHRVSLPPPSKTDQVMGIKNDELLNGVDFFHQGGS
jgi:hypothetical protein